MTRHININAMPSGESVLHASEPLSQGQLTWNEVQDDIAHSNSLNSTRGKEEKHRVAPLKQLQQPTGKDKT